MVEQIRIFVRYDTTDEKGQTRRQKNEAFGASSPELVIRSEIKYLWDWYLDLSRSVPRSNDGNCLPIPPSEFLAWREATGNIVHPVEYGILRAMDIAYCDEMGKEISAYHERMADQPTSKGKRPNG